MEYYAMTDEESKAHQAKRRKLKNKVGEDVCFLVLI
jgi:hypothetical protein